ncbi:hypothetical protein [Nitrosophilus labii]|uniref:hypothetical protein n=1 Tax=Nitrosophilus labii TaxID=2706014 RepID=UPI001657451C|nr:hypothetical protein [Nitrosophilus labii]
MKRLFSVLIVSVLYFSTLQAKNYYGKLSYTVMFDNTENSTNKTEKSSYIQNYELGYTSFIYSPYLLTYDLGFGLLIDNSKSTVTNENSSYTVESDVKNINYRFYADIIKKSNYPFTIYKEKTESPVWNIQAGSSLLSTYNLDAQGIRGSIKNNIVNIGYAYRDSTSEQTTAFSYENQKRKKFLLTFNKEFEKNINANLTLEHENRDYYKEDRGINYIDQWSDSYDSALANLSWKISDISNLTSYAKYLNNTYLQLESITAYINHTYSPNRKWRLNSSLLADSVSSNGTKNNYLTLNLNNIYNFDNNISTRQNLQVFNARGDSADMTLTSLTLGASYQKSLTKDLIGTLSLDVTGRAEKYRDQNITLDDRNMLSYTLTAGLSKNFKEAKSSISSDLSFYQLISTGVDAIQRISANARYNKMFKENINFNISLYSTLEKNEYLDNNQTQSVSKTYYGLNNSLSYWTNVGYRGKFSANLGFRYSGGNYTKRTNPYANSEFLYTLRRDLIFRVLGKVTSDTVYGLTTYTSKAELVYKVRKVKVSVGSAYSAQTGSEEGQRTHTNIYFRIERKL